MARPSLTDITNGASGWDAVVNDNFSKVVDTPFPVAVAGGSGAAAVETSFPAANYDNCLAADTAGVLYISDGATWNKVGGQ